MNEQGDQLQTHGYILDSIQSVAPGFAISDGAQPMFEKVLTRMAKVMLPIAEISNFRDPRKTLKSIAELEAEGGNQTHRISQDLEKSWRRLFDTVTPRLSEEVYAKVLVGALPFKHLQDAPMDLTYDSFVTWRDRLDLNPVVEPGFLKRTGIFGNSKGELSRELLAVYYIHQDPIPVQRKKKERATGQSGVINWGNLFGGNDEGEPGERSFEQALKLADKWRNSTSDKGNVGLYVARMYSRYVERMAKNRLFCSTSQGRVGWVPAEAEAGDTVCILNGARVPFILRPIAGRDSVFRLVGEAYIHGLMQGGVEADEGCDIIIV
jgi:hypothetical protein